jgi:hypothetical protein
VCLQQHSWAGELHVQGLRLQGKGLLAKTPLGSEVEGHVEWACLEMSLCLREPFLRQQQLHFGARQSHLRHQPIFQGPVASVLQVCKASLPPAEGCPGQLPNQKVTCHPVAARGSYTFTFLPWGTRHPSHSFISRVSWMTSLA